MSILHRDATGVNDDRPHPADRDWWAQQSPDWHDLDGGPDYDDRDCGLDYELEAEAEVARWFRRRRHGGPCDLDQPWYAGLGTSAGYRDRI